MSKNLEIAKMLVLSTSHVTKETAEQLPRGHTDMDSEDDIPDWGPTFAREEGWVFYVPTTLRDDAPPELKACGKVAEEAGCIWLMFDRDGETVDNLPTYEW